MQIELITQTELYKFKQELLEEIKALIQGSKKIEKKLLKASEVKKLLKISSGTLQTLRINGTLPYSKIGGTIYYDYDDIIKLLEKNKIAH